MSTHDYEVHRAVVVSSSVTTGEAVVVVPALLGADQQVSIPTTGLTQVGGLWNVPSVGASTFVAVSSDRTQFLWITAVTVPSSGDDQEVVDSLQFNIDSGLVADQEGLLVWNEDWGTVDIGLHGTKATLHVGQQVYYYAKNQTGSQIDKGTVVRFDGALGASGHLKMAPFLADGTYPSEYIMGITAHDIPNGDDGYVVHFGAIRGIDTDTPNWNEGDVLYASPTVAGEMTNTVPTAPNNIVLLAAVVNRHQQNGELFVRPTIASNILKDEGIIYTNLSDNQLLSYDSAQGVFVNETFSPTITLAGDATGSVTLNDLGDGTLTVAVVDDSHNHSTYAASIHSHSYLPLTGGTLTGNISIDSTTPILTLLGSDSSYAEMRAIGTSQGTGVLFAGQSSTYGGGVFYNGDGTPAYATGEGVDQVSFFRRNNGTNEVVFYYPYNSNTVTFRDTPTVNGTAVSVSGHTHSYLPLAGGTLTGTLTSRTISVGTAYSIDFGANVRQMLNLWNTQYGIGVQSNTLYFRSGDTFSWHAGGSHNNSQGNPGGGTHRMMLDGNGIYLYNGWFRTHGTSGLYFQTYGSGVTHPAYHGGTYGSVATYGSYNSWNGFSCDGKAVFMNNASNWGIYDDQNNAWQIYATLNGNVDLRSAGSVVCLTAVSGTVNTASPATSTSSGYQYVFRNNTFGTLYRYTSKRELKENISDITNSGEIIDALRPVTFIPKFVDQTPTATSNGDNDPARIADHVPLVETDEQKALREQDLNYGFIAEEVALVADGKLAQYEWTEDDIVPSGWKWSDVIAVLVAETQNIRTRLAQLEAS